MNASLGDKLSWRDVIRIAYSSFYIQALWSYEKMLSAGYANCLLPVARRCLSGVDELKAYMVRNLRFFNTHPYMAGWIIGAALKMDFDASSNRISPEQADRFRKRLSESLGAIGDQLFWNTLKPLTALLGVMTAVYCGIAGLVVFLLLYNLPHFYHRVIGPRQGFSEGLDVIKRLSFRRYHGVLKKLGSVSALVSGIAFSLTLGRHVGVPDLMLALVSSLLASWALLKKQISASQVLCVVICISCILGYLIT